MPYYLGIDGGGTKTVCAIGDESAMLSTVTAGPSNVIRVGEKRARESLHACVRGAIKAAGIAPEQIARTCVGGSGAARPEIAELLRGILAEILVTPVDVVGDMEIALEAAFGTRSGVIVVAGTGSIAFGRNALGQTARTGGWGFAIGDEGSAHWIGRNAASAVLRAADETPDGKTHSPLAERLCQIWKVQSLADLAGVANSNPAPDFASLFPALLSGSDELAHDILRQAGRELARIGALVIQRLFSESQESIAVAVAGGVFRHSEMVRQMFCSELRKLERRAIVIPEVVEPVEGALSLARKSGRRSPD